VILGQRLTSMILRVHQRMLDSLSTFWQTPCRAIPTPVGPPGGTSQTARPSACSGSVISVNAGRFYSSVAPMSRRISSIQRIMKGTVLRLELFLHNHRPGEITNRKCSHKNPLGSHSNFWPQASTGRVGMEPCAFASATTTSNSSNTSATVMV